MALIIPGKTTCGICTRPLLKGESVTSFPPFVSNQLDPVYVFSDGAFHEQCFDAHPHAAEARRRLEELRARTARGHRKCLICGQEIDRPDEYVSFGHIADQPPNLRRMNYLQFHRQHLSNWSELQVARDALIDLVQSRTWKGPGLQRLIEQLEVALNDQKS